MVLMAVCMLAFLGVCGLGIDAGHWYQSRRDLQAAADASALAGASQLAINWGTAQNTARSQYAKNGLSSDSVSYGLASDLAPNDSVTVSATRQVGTWFASVFGVGSVTISVQARATVESLSTVNPGPGSAIMPWGVLQNTYVPGAAYSIYTKSTLNANNGAINLPYQSASSCTPTSGSTNYTYEIDGVLTPCPVTVGETVNTNPGNNTGPTAQGLNIRITTWQPLSQIAQVSGTGQATLLDATSPQLVLIPVVVNQTGASAWPSGSSAPMTITGFAYFVITSCGDPLNPTYCANTDGKQINGIFIGLDDATTAGSTSGAWNPNPGTDTAYTTALTQ
jgi:Putative Flp pilus-assembly TadE/G-like